MNKFTAFWFRWGIYMVISFLTMLAVVYPITRIGSLIIIFGYGLYIVSDTFTQYTLAYRESFNKDRAIMMAFSNNLMDMVAFIMVITIGIYLGVS